MESVAASEASCLKAPVAFSLSFINKSLTHAHSCTHTYTLHKASRPFSFECRADWEEVLPRIMKPPRPVKRQKTTEIKIQNKAQTEA